MFFKIENPKILFIICFLICDFMNGGFDFMNGGNDFINGNAKRGKMASNVVPFR